RTQRDRFAVLSEAQEAGEIALDDTVILSPNGRSTSHLQRVEVECKAGSSKPLEELVTRLCTECNLQPAEGSKYDEGLKAAKVTIAGWNPGSRAISPSMRISELTRVNLQRQLAAWLACEPGARLGEDPECLHDMRVAGRRLDVTIRLFEKYLPKSIVRCR